MFAPLAFAYIASISASLLVALTVTPALCYYLLGRSRLLHEEKDSWLVRWLKARYAKTLHWSLGHPFQVISSSLALLIVALMVFPLMGREFLPPFNEGALNINITLPPGTSLQESNRIGRTVEEVLTDSELFPRLAVPACSLMSTAGVNMSEIEVVAKPLRRIRGGDGEVRQNLAQVPGVVSEVGQPTSIVSTISFRNACTDCVKLFGSDPSH